MAVIIIIGISQKVIQDYLNNISKTSIKHIELGLDFQKRLLHG